MICSVILMSLAVDHVMANIVKDCQLSRLLRLERTEEKEAEKFEGGEMLTGEDLAMRYGGGGRALLLPIFYLFGTEEAALIPLDDDAMTCKDVQSELARARAHPGAFVLRRFFFFFFLLRTASRRTCRRR